MHTQKKAESHAVARKTRDAAYVLFGLKFTDNIHYKFKCIPKLRMPDFDLQTYWRKTEFNEDGHSKSFKITCFGVSGKAIMD